MLELGIERLYRSLGSRDAYCSLAAMGALRLSVCPSY